MGPIDTLAAEGVVSPERNGGRRRPGEATVPQQCESRAMIAGLGSYPFASAGAAVQRSR